MFGKRIGRRKEEKKIGEKEKREINYRSGVAMPTAGTVAAVASE